MKIIEIGVLRIELLLRKFKQLQSCGYLKVWHDPAIYDYISDLLKTTTDKDLLVRCKSSSIIFNCARFISLETS